VGRAIRLGVVGAGSATFSLGLLRDRCLQESLRGSQVVFMDVDEERLARILDLARRYTAELGVDLRFEATSERERALRDADVVLVQTILDDPRTRSLECAEDTIDAMLELPRNRDLAERFGPRLDDLPDYDPAVRTAAPS